MGIDGLHGVLKPYLRHGFSLRELAGQRLGVDASSWLHRGAVGVAADLAAGARPWEARGADAPWVAFCLKMVRAVQTAGCTPVLVFDGRRLPAKEATNAARRARREEARARAQRLLSEGREAEAAGVLQQSVAVTAEMAQELVVRLRQLRVEFVVAPYEADAQLAYLCSLPEWQGGVAAVITEDSDLVAYGCRRVLFKMDGAGYCQELQLDRLFAGPEAALAPPAAPGGGSGGSGGGGAGSKGGGGVVSLKGWTLEMLQAACVLAGCDFLPSLRGVSFRTAAAFVARRRSLDGALKALRLEKRFQLLATAEYCGAAEQAALAFRHALAFCPNTRGGSCVRLAPAPEGADLAHLGAELDERLARGIAYGHLHPHTLEEFPAPAPPPPPPQQQQQRRQPSQQQQPWQQQSQQSQQSQRPQWHRSSQQQQQQQQASIASQRQLGSWMTAGAARPASQQQQHGLGPSQPAQPLPPQLLARVQQQWEGVQPLPASQQQQQRRQQLAAGSASWDALMQQQQQQQPASTGSQEEAQTQAVLGSSGAGSSSQQRQPMQPITNWPEAAAVPAGTQGSAACAPQSQALAAPPAERVWNRAEQYVPPPSASRFSRQPQQQGARGTPSPAAAGSKRKSSGGGGGSAKKSAAAKPLAPPSQRISRFFVPLGKRAQR